MDEPVLIAGAGPVGVAAGLLLARWEVPSVVLETEPGPDEIGSKAICMQRDVLDVLDRVGCAEPMVAEGVTWSVARTYYREHELFAVTFPGRERDALPPWINISQCSTEGYLFDLVERTELVDVRFDHPVHTVRQDASGVEADVEAPDGPHTLRGSHLIGADGARSAVREERGIDMPGRSFDDLFLICDIRADLPFPNERRFFFDPEWNPGRQVLVHPCPGSVWRIDWQVPSDYDLEAERSSGALDERIRRITGDIPYEVVWLTVYRFHERVAAAFRDGRVLLAGDAAHLYAPFGARGLNSGIQDADNLAWKLAFIRRGWVGDGAAEVLLESYNTERRAAAAENLRVTNATMEFLVPQTGDQGAWRRAVLEQAVTDPEARGSIDSGTLAEPYWYLHSPLTSQTCDLSDFPTAAGTTRPPVPGAICPDGPCVLKWAPDVTRLRRLFGRGFVVLTARSDRVAEAAGVGADASRAPTYVYALPDIDQNGVLAEALRAGPDSAHVIRPDGHLAAVIHDFDREALDAALRRACGEAPLFSPESV